MSPIEAVLTRVSRTLAFFHPNSVPRLARLHYRRELLAWVFLPVLMGAVEGGVVAVVAKNAFAGTVSDRWLNVVVAILSGAPAFSNVTSFLWASLSHGRNKIRFLVALQVAACLLVAQVALAPANGVGLAMLTLAAVGARVCWSGVVTVRSTVWRANYPRHARASLAGKLATVQSIMLAGVGLAIGLSMRRNEQSFHLLYPIAAGFGLVGAIIYSGMRMRGHAAFLQRERRAEAAAGWIGGGGSPLTFWSILGRDRPFRQYMIAMFVFGIGNLMVSAPLVIMLRDVFGYGYLGGILIMSTIPLILMPVSIPVWSRMLDRMHIIRFRVIHSWSFVATTGAVLAAALLYEPVRPLSVAVLWTAAVLKGVAFGGGVLGWNLGHHDFAPAELASQYMGVHVTLTGIRGLIGPPVAVGIYEILESARPGAGGWVFAVCLALNLAGAAAFALLRYRESSPPDDDRVGGPSPPPAVA